MSEPLIEIEAISKSYRRDKITVPVIEALSLTIQKGDFFALMGPSGSGKSTLLNLIAGIDRPDRGKICVAGIDLATLGESDLAQWRARHIGYIFQFYNLIPVLTALENVMLPLLLTPLSKPAQRHHAEAALDMVGLSEYLHRLPKQLSGGQEQRVAIARAIVTDPTLIVADEPTGDLDKVSAEEILNLLTRLNREFSKTILMVTHDPRAATIAQTVRSLDKGVLSDPISPQKSHTP